MPQASERLRAMFEHDGDAMTVLENAGWTHVFCTWTPPAGERTQREWDALDYLIDEWDHAYRMRSR